MKILATKRRLIVKYIAIAVISIVFITIGTIPIKRAIAQYKTPNPEAILTLGGGSDREIFTAQFALEHPNLPVWISSGSKEMLAREIFQKIGVNNRRVYIDRRATDTVTNFTTLANDFKQQSIGHIYLITSDYHLPRAKAIASIVLGSKGIIYTPISLASNRDIEPKYKVARDVVRSVFWVFTKRTGSTLNGRKNI